MAYCPTLLTPALEWTSLMVFYPMIVCLWKDELEWGEAKNTFLLVEFLIILQMEGKHNFE